MVLNNYSSMNIIREIWMVLMERINFESQTSALLTPLHYSNSRNSIISFDNSSFSGKSLSNFVFLSWKLLNRYCHNTNSRAKGKNSHTLVFCFAFCCDCFHSIISKYQRKSLCYFVFVATAVGSSRLWEKVFLVCEKVK